MHIQSSITSLKWMCFLLAIITGMIEMSLNTVDRIAVIRIGFMSGKLLRGFVG